MGTYTLFAVLILIVSLLLVLVIMIQNPKGGGLSSSFGGGGQMMGGVQKTNDFLNKATWSLAVVMVGLILMSNFVIPRDNVGQSSVGEKIQNVQLPTTTQQPKQNEVPKSEDKK